MGVFDKLKSQKEEMGWEETAELIKEKFVVGSDEDFLKKVRKTLKGSNPVLKYLFSGTRFKTLLNKQNNFMLYVSHGTFSGANELYVYDNTKEIKYIPTGKNYKGIVDAVITEIDNVSGKI